MSPPLESSALKDTRRFMDGNAPLYVNFSMPCDLILDISPRRSVVKGKLLIFGVSLYIYLVEDWGIRQQDVVDSGLRGGNNTCLSISMSGPWRDLILSVLEGGGIVG